jgi:hypothetical protein
MIYPTTLQSIDMLVWLTEGSGESILTGWKMFSEIKQLKATGLNKSQTARHLGINVKTVSRYWNVDADGFAEIRLCLADQAEGPDSVERPEDGTEHG